MSLPSGYKRLEYIQSSGTQFIETGVPSTSKTGFEIEFSVSAPSSITAITGAFNYGGYNNNFAAYSGAWMTQYGNNGGNQFGTADTGRHKVSQNVESGNVYFDDTLKYSGLTYYDNTARTFRLFCYNGGASYPTFWIGAATIYSAKYFENGVLVRDFIPCKNASNAVGLWDDVNSAFYANAGTGAFEAGPEVPTAPLTPTDFSGSYDGENITLSWAASTGADGYKVYKNGTEIADITETFYTDKAEQFTITAYGVSAYNAYGESEQAQTTVPAFPDNPILYLITDRTNADLTRLKRLLAIGWDNMTAEEKAEFSASLKGAYNATDLNRVGAAVLFLEDYLNGVQSVLDDYRSNHGVAADQIFNVTWGALALSVKVDWIMSDIPSVSQMSAYLQNVGDVTACIAITRSLPSGMDNLTISGANSIEKALLDEYSAGLDFEADRKHIIDLTAAAWFYSGDIYGGDI